MNSRVMDGRWRWTIAASGGALTLAALLAIFSVPQIVPLATAPAASPPAVTFADPGSVHALNREATALRDLAPLFLPTERNATLERMPRRESGQTFFDVETTRPAFTEGELHFDQDLPPPVTLNGKVVPEAKPADALASVTLSPPALGFGRSDVVVSALPPRGGFLEVVAAGTGLPVMSASLPVEVAAPTDKPWQPLQFLASVNAAGLVGPLILTERSGVEEVDQHFRIYLTQAYRMGERLRPGIYRLTIGP